MILSKETDNRFGIQLRHAPISRPPFLIHFESNPPVSSSINSDFMKTLVRVEISQLDHILTWPQMSSGGQRAGPTPLILSVFSHHSHEHPRSIMLCLTKDYTIIKMRWIASGCVVFLSVDSPSNLFEGLNTRLGSRHGSNTNAVACRLAAEPRHSSSGPTSCNSCRRDY